MENKIKKFTLAELEKLAEGKRIFEFNPHLSGITRKKVKALLGREYSSIKQCCSSESFIIICSKRDSYKETILDFFPPDSDCAKGWNLSNIQFGVETLVKIGDPHKNKVTPIGSCNLLGNYILLKVSEDIYFLWAVEWRGDRVIYLNYIEPISE